MQPQGDKYPTRQEQSSYSLTIRVPVVPIRPFLRMGGWPKRHDPNVGIRSSLMPPSQTKHGRQGPSGSICLGQLVGGDPVSLFDVRIDIH